MEWSLLVFVLVIDVGAIIQKKPDSIYMSLAARHVKSRVIILRGIESMRGVGVVELYLIIGVHQVLCHLVVLKEQMDDVLLVSECGKMEDCPGNRCKTNAVMHLSFLSLTSRLAPLSRRYLVTFNVQVKGLKLSECTQRL